MSDDALRQRLFDPTVLMSRLRVRVGEIMRIRYGLGLGYALACILTVVAVSLASSAPGEGPIGPASRAVLALLIVNLLLILALVSAVGWQLSPGLYKSISRVLNQDICLNKTNNLSQKNQSSPCKTTLVTAKHLISISYLGLSSLRNSLLPRGD